MGVRELVGALGCKAVPARAGACRGVWLAALHGKTRTSHCPSLPFLYHIALGYSPQLPIARLPLEPGKSSLLCSHPLGLGICSAFFFFFSQNYLLCFALIAVYFPILAVAFYC